MTSTLAATCSSTTARQVKNRDYRGPDFFFVWGVERDRMRPYWAV
jgi:hypothetical protein